MKQLLIAFLAASALFAQVPQFDPLLNDLTAPKSSGASLATEAACAIGTATTTACTPAGVAAALGGCKLVVTSATVLTVPAPCYYATGTDKRTIAVDVTFTIHRPNLSSCNNAPATVCTASETLDESSLRSGEYVNISGAVTCGTNLNGLRQVIARSGTSITLDADCTAGAPTGTIVMGSNASAAGDTKVYGARNTTAIVIEHPRAAGLYIVASLTTATVRQVVSPGFQTGDEIGNFPVATVAISTTSNGTYGTPTDERAFYRTQPIAEGTNICFDTSGSTPTISTCANVVTEDGDHAFTGNMDFEAASLFRAPRGFSFSFGDPAGSALSAGSTTTVYVTVPYVCAIRSWAIVVDAGTATVKFWRKATGTAIPTSSDSINTSGVAISTGTAVRSTTLSDFTSTAIAAGDIVAANISTVATAKYLNVTLGCN